MCVSVAMAHGEMEGKRQWDMGWEWMARMAWPRHAQHNTTMKARNILGVSSVKPAKASSMACLSMLDKEGSKEGSKDATKQPILQTTNTQQLEQHQQTTTSQPN